MESLNNFNCRVEPVRGADIFQSAPLNVHWTFRPETPPPPPSLTSTWNVEQITFLKLPHKGMQMQNVTAMDSKHFKLRTFKKIIFIILSFHGRTIKFD